MNELGYKTYLFFQTSAAKVLPSTDYEIITKMIIPSERLLHLVAHSVKAFIIVV
jgi:hypothetical protein